MRVSRRILRRLPSRLLLSIGVLACMTGVGVAAAPSAEFDSFHAAIVAQDKRTALAFIRGFPSSLLVDHLIKLLPREVAQEVCAELPSKATRAQIACRNANMGGVARDLWGQPVTAAETGIPQDAPQPPSRVAAFASVPDADTAPAPQEVVGSQALPAGSTGERPVDARAGSAGNDRAAANGPAASGPAASGPAASGPAASGSSGPAASGPTDSADVGEHASDDHEHDDEHHERDAHD